MRVRFAALTLALAALLAGAATPANADWWQPRSAGSGREGAGSPSPRPQPQAAPPADCRWVVIARRPQSVDPQGRTVYEITQRNSCTGEIRTLYGY
jgi:hypothetical protein